MLQVLQRYNTSSNTSKGSGDDQRNSELRRQLQQHGIPAELFLSGGLEPITLHYSLHPWGSDVLPQEAHPAQPVGNPQDALTLVNDENCFTDGATRVASAVHLKFDFSNKHVPVQLRDPLTLLAVLHAAATNWPSLLQWQSLRRGAGSRQDASTEEPLQLQPPNISHSEFVNLKLNNKAMRHCSSLLLAGQHTATWAVMLALDCGYLFTPQTRMFLFEVSFFGTARSLTRMQEVLSEDAGGVGDTTSSSSSAANAQRRHTRLHRKKLRVWRDCPLSSAIAILSKHHASGDVLEMEFYGEPGSGLGPTLEFFTLTGASIREMKHQLWRRSGEESEADKHYSSPLGLYPRPLPPNSPEANRLAPYFRFIGQLLARGLIDKRQLNLRLSPPLLKLLRGDVMTIDDVAYINDGLYRVLRAILIAVRHGVNSLELGGKAPCTVEDLCLTFVCPGADDIELVKGGSDISVTFENAEQYVRAVVGFMLKTGVERFARELRLGFHACLPLYSLRAVQLDELGAYINGHEAPVTMQDLEAHVHVDHGFTASSPAVRFLFEVIASKPVDAQRRFFQFLTGSPHLPMGGLQMLRPRFTVVRKTSTDPKVPEQDQLPSSMTCQNYLKLPAYETKDLLCRKLELAVEEGCGAFLFT
jgi:E3 ubiquitin-protein ligase TRIP12